MTYVRSRLFTEIGRNCRDISPHDTEKLDSIGKTTIALLAKEFGIMALRAGIDEVLSSHATDDELNKAWQHTGARIWFGGAGTRHYFQTLKAIADAF